ncbi:MAG: membrane protein insertase YidC, partial [Pseudomonadota bacterium]
IAENKLYNGRIDWVGLGDRYFMTALIPNQTDSGAAVRVSEREGHIFTAVYQDPADSIPSLSEHAYSYKVYLGPKSLDILSGIDNKLARSIDFGWFDLIAKPLLHILNFFKGLIGNYGIAIIILTILIKIVFWPLSTKSYKSMSDMKKLQPKMEELRKKYKDDRQKINLEVMNLYRTYKVNPLAGCLPMLLQIPVFLAFYKVLYQAIELRHAPFFGWITDLSAPDRLFKFGFSIPFMEPPYGIPVLTIIMGASMFIQQKMSPPPGDPTQAKIMMFMPIMFTVIFVNFASGLVLYWMVNNILSIGQQYYITKKTA